MFYNKIRKIILIIVCICTTGSYMYGMLARSLQPVSRALFVAARPVTVQKAATAVACAHAPRATCAFSEQTVTARVGSYWQERIRTYKEKRARAQVCAEFDGHLKTYLTGDAQDKKPATDQDDLVGKLARLSVSAKKFTHQYFLEMLMVVGMFGSIIAYYHESQQKEDLQKLLEALQTGYVNDEEETCARAHTEVIEAFYTAIMVNQKYAALANQAFADYIRRTNKIPSQALFNILLLHGPEPKILINALDEKKSDHEACLQKAAKYCHQEAHKQKELAWVIALRMDELNVALRGKFADLADCFTLEQDRKAPSSSSHDFWSYCCTSQ